MTAVEIDLGAVPGIAETLCIRNWRSSDVFSLVHSANNQKIADQLRDRFPHPYTVAHAEEWLAHASSAESASSFAIAADQRAIGGISLELQRDVHCRAAELGYWLAEPYWGHGIATRAVIEFTGFAFTRYDLIRIYAAVFETNGASARVLEKAGYRFEGRLRMSVVKKGRVLDQLLYSKLSLPPVISG